MQSKHFEMQLNYYKEQSEKQSHAPSETTKSETSDISPKKIQESNEPQKAPKQKINAKKEIKPEKTELKLSKTPLLPTIQPFTKDKVNALNLNLYELVRCLREAMNELMIVKDKDIVLSIGNTGTGKTTMINSLCFGSGNLELKNIVEKSKLKSGKMKEMKKQIIEQKDSIKDMNVLKIGHSTS